MLRGLWVYMLRVSGFLRYAVSGVRIFLFLREAREKMTFFEVGGVKYEQKRAKCSGNTWQQMEKHMEGNGR